MTYPNLDANCFRNRAMTTDVRPEFDYYDDIQDLDAREFVVAGGCAWRDSGPYPFAAQITFHRVWGAS